MMDYVPFGDRVLIEIMENENITESGLFLPESSQQKSQQGIIVAKNDNENCNELSVGMKVLFSKYAGTEIKINGKIYLVININDILLTMNNMGN